MLDQQLAAQLKAYLERVTQPFELVASLDEGKSSAELRSLLEQIAGMSDKITLCTDGDDARKPSFTLQRNGSTARVRHIADLLDEAYGGSKTKRAVIGRRSD